MVEVKADASTNHFDPERHKGDRREPWPACKFVNLDWGALQMSQVIESSVAW